MNGRRPEDWLRNLLLRGLSFSRQMYCAQELRASLIYDLRAADALQLAAALEWSAGIPHGKKFLATDRKLQEAAMLTGFEGE